MSERIDDPSFEDYSWVDDERRLHENGGQQAQPDLWNAYRHDAGDSSFAYNGKLYVHSGGNFYEGTPVAGGDFTLSGIPQDEATRIQNDYAQYLFEQGPGEPGLEEPFIDPISLIGGGASKGLYAVAKPAGSVIARIGSGLVAGAKGVLGSAAFQTGKQYFKK